MNRTPIFDAVRALLGRGFDQSEVDRLDAACALAEAALPADAARLPASACPPPLPAIVRRELGAAGLRLIKTWEGCERRQADGTFRAYPDPGSSDGEPWTIGWGSTGADICQDTVWSSAQCDARFARDVQVYCDAVSRAIGTAPTTQGQFDALVSFHYNTGAIARAALTRKHVAGDHAAAAGEFSRWIYNAGKPMAGLKRRRAAEAALYRGD